MVIYQDRYLSKELISTSKTNGWTIHLEQFETKSSIFFIFNALILFKIFAPISEKQCVYDGELSSDLSMPTSFCCNYFNVPKLHLLLKHFSTFLLMNVFHKEFCNVIYIHRYDAEEDDDHYIFLDFLRFKSKSTILFTIKTEQFNLFTTYFWLRGFSFNIKTFTFALLEE